MAEIPHLIRKIAQYLDAWKGGLVAAHRKTQEAEKYLLECRQKEASIQSRLRLLGQLAATMDSRFAERSQQERFVRRERALAAAETWRLVEGKKREESERERLERAERHMAAQEQEGRSGGDNE